MAFGRQQSLIQIEQMQALEDMIHRIEFACGQLQEATLNAVAATKELNRAVDKARTESRRR